MVPGTITILLTTVNISVMVPGTITNLLTRGMIDD